MFFPDIPEFSRKINLRRIAAVGNAGKINSVADKFRKDSAHGDQKPDFIGDPDNPTVRRFVNNAVEIHLFPQFQIRADRFLRHLGVRNLIAEKFEPAWNSVQIKVGAANRQLAKAEFIFQTVQDFSVAGDREDQPEEFRLFRRPENGLAPAGGKRNSNLFSAFYMFPHRRKTQNFFVFMTDNGFKTIFRVFI